MTKFALTLIAFGLMTSPPGFKEQQMKFDRVKSAFSEKSDAVKTLLKTKDLDAGFHLFIRAFKKERVVEIWAKKKEATSYSMLTTYDFCRSSGILGPKRKEGDLQIPEGMYSINHFNPLSTFHLSLGINYPNASDRILSDKDHPGGAIYLHGNCVTTGCIPITDEKIKELYVLAVEARNGGQENIPVHIFPSRLEFGVVEQLASATSADESVKEFWENLEGVYSDFQMTKELQKITVNKKGRYQILNYRRM